MRTLTALRTGLIGGVSMVGLLAMPALAQTKSAAAGAATENTIEEIVVTAQRTAQSLQDVPIAVSAFSAETLQRQQIRNSSDLQLSLPNITFTKTNFTGSSFTIRGVGDLCTGTTCDAATGIATNEMPLFGTRLFETEFFDLERVEVLRGPQGTLFGRNATSGVVNFVTAKPDARAIHSAGEVQYGNYNAIQLKGMFNLPVTEQLAVRVAGFYSKRDGYTTNTFDNTKIDDRNLYALRGSVRWTPTDNTTVDLMAYYFHEDDNRMRIQKQLCTNDPTGVLGCLPGPRTNGVLNANGTLASVLTSKEFLTLNGVPPSVAGALALGSIYGPNNAYTGTTSSPDVRTVSTAFTPVYKTSEQQYMGRVKHDFGTMTAQASGMYQTNNILSQQDYNVQAPNKANFIAGLTGLQALANGPIPSLKPLATALTPSGPNGPYCTSAPDVNNAGIFGGQKICGSVPLNFDQSSGKTRTWTGEAIVESHFDGPFDFVLGGIYSDLKATNGDYFVNGFGLDYASGLLGGGIAGTPGYLATPFYRNNSALYTLKSYGIFGEAYYKFSDSVKATIGLRYNHDEKFVSARTSLLNCPNLIGAATASLACGDFDPSKPGTQAFANQGTSSGKMTGRAVIDWKVSDESLLYASYSRGYKSGGINPPLSPGTPVPTTFQPEQVDAFEIGSKNTFLNGTLRANLTAFYYKYKGLQISSIQQRTSVNENINASIYGLEGEFVIQPVQAFTVNMTASYLHATVSGDQFLVNPADPSGRRGDAVIVKDITNAAACSVSPKVAGNSALANGYVASVNAGLNAAIPGLGLKAPVAFPDGSGLTPGTTGAFGLCSALAASASAAGVNVDFVGTPVNVRGNTLPQAPTYKFSAGAQYVIDFSNGMSMTPRADIAFTGNSWGSVHNTLVNRIESYYVINAQLQVNGPDNKWYLRAFVQNLTNNNAVTGLYVTDQTSGLFTNIFTLEPRRYGAAVGFNF